MKKAILAIAAITALVLASAYDIRISIVPASAHADGGSCNGC